MENKMETTIVYWGYIGILEKKMETTICNPMYFSLLDRRSSYSINSLRGLDTGLYTGAL